MKIAQKAMAARGRGDLEGAASLAAAALVPEQIAADMMVNSPNSEPTRSSLYLSAASLAFQAGDDDAALELVAKGRAGFPLAQTARDFDNLIALVEKRRQFAERPDAAAPDPV